jgi:hypothetical protein
MNYDDKKYLKVIVWGNIEFNSDILAFLEKLATASLQQDQHTQNTRK